MSQLSQQQIQLPVYQYKQKIIDTIINGDNPVTIICAATGSGKSTQIPQYLLEYTLSQNETDKKAQQTDKNHINSYKNIRITVTQPRRVAAISLAHRVSFERKTKVGGEVGYSVRFDDKSTPSTKIRYVTDGVAVTEATQFLQQKQDEAYKIHIFIVDEAHEKSVQTEIMLGILQKKLADQQSDSSQIFKVVIMSATINAEAFARYFRTPQVLFIQGRTFPIRHFFTENTEKNYIEVASLTILQATQAKAKTILVFLPGDREIKAVESTLQVLDKEQQLEILLLHSSLSQEQQMMIFQPRKANTRVVLSTNIAETSITVPDVDTVIDCGFVRIKVFEEGINRLITVPVSKAQVLQRSGRAGRTCPGKVYHLYTKDTYDKLSMTSTSELERCDLRQVFLALLSQNIHNVSAFKFISEPGQQRRKHALEDLLKFKLVEPFYIQNDQTQLGLRLTELGKQISQLPLDIESSLTIIRAIQKHNYQLLENVCQLLAVLDSQEQIFISSSENNQPARTIFKDNTSDHIMLLKIYIHFTHAQNKQQFSKQHDISLNTMIYVEKAFKQIFQCVCDLLKKQKDNYEQLLASKSKDALDVYNIEQNIQTIKNDILECLAYGFKHHISNAKNDNKTFIWKGHLCKIHPSSNVKFGDIILYHQMVQTTNLYMRIVSVLDPQLLQHE